MSAADLLRGAPGARPVATRQVAAAREAVRHVCATGTVAAFIGPANSGKSFAAEVATELDCAGTVIRWAVPTRRMTEYAFLTGLVSTLSGVRQEGIFNELLDAGRSSLNEHSGLVVIEHAENLNRHMTDLLRHLRLDAGPGSALLLVGRDDAESAVTRLGGDVTRRVAFDALAGEELLAALRRLHPILETAPAELLGFVDANYASGLLGEWMNFTREAIAFCQRHDAPLDQEAALRIFALRGRVVTTKRKRGKLAA